jgi:CheY-like chemotaxis protein
VKNSEWHLICSHLFLLDAMSWNNDVMSNDLVNNAPSCAPLFNPAAEPFPDLTERNHWQARQTILLAEDEPFVRNALAEAVGSAGYNVLVASNAAEALELQRSGTEMIDLLLADVVMPNIGGHELARRILALSPQTEVLLTSGYEEQVIRCEQSMEGIAYLAKPFSIPTLLQRVRELLGRRSCHQQASA